MKTYVEECPSWSFPAEYEDEHRFVIGEFVKPDRKFGQFIRRNGILLIGLILLIVWTWAIATIAYHNGKVDATETLTAEYEREIELAKQSVREEYAAEKFTSGEASKQAAIAQEAKHLARVGQGVLNTYKAADIDDAEKAMLCVVCRVISGGEFAGVTNIEDAAKARDQWWGYTDAYTKEVYERAKEIATIYENGDALPCPVNMVYASWNGSEIVLRDQWQANANARYWS